MKYSIHSMFYSSLVDAADFNKNNRMNILVTIRYRKNRRIFVGNHSETFLNQSPYSFDTNSSVLSIAVGGFNSGNQSDIAISNTNRRPTDIYFGYD